MQVYWCVYLLAGLLATYGVESQVTSDCYDERPDCSKITDMNPSRLAFENYCLFWKNDAAVKQCRKTCQFCKPYAPECKDELDSCKNIAAYFRGDSEGLKRYCELFKNSPEVQKCKATCSHLCIRDIEFPPNDCKDEKDEVDVCNNIVNAYNGDEQKIQGFCERFKDDPVVKKCKRTCRLCKASGPVLIRQVVRPTSEEPQVECEDKSDRCKDIVTMHKGVQKDIIKYCERHSKNAIVQKCTKTCQKCKTTKAPSQPKECNDEAPNCYDIVFMHKGKEKDIPKYCEKHKDNPTVKKCKKTCPELCR